MLVAVVSNDEMGVLSGLGAPDASLVTSTNANANRHPIPVDDSSTCPVEPPDPLGAGEEAGKRAAPDQPSSRESTMTATYTFDVFSTLDGYGAHRGNWGGYWGKQGPDFLDRRLALYEEQHRMVFGPTRIARTRRCWPRAPRMPRSVTHGSPA